MRILQKRSLRKCMAVALVAVMLCPGVVNAEGETNPEEILEVTTEDTVQENTTEVTTEEVSEEMSGDNTELILEDVSEETIEETTEDLSGTSPMAVSYKTHIQSIGWQDYVSNGVTSGTTGSSKRMEAMQIRIDNPEYAGGVTYRTHVQSYGWKDWVSDDTVSGTTGEAKRIEAVQIKLTGELAEHYDIYYRVHAQSYGWLGWAKNGKTAGTTGLAKRLEAIEICLVEKGGTAPGSTKNTSHCTNNISYRTHVQTYGWEDYVSSGAVAGTTGLAKRLEGINIKVNTGEYSGGIRYCTHVQTYGWQDYVSDGAMSGTEGKAKRLEAIKIELTGELAQYYDVYYRVHCQTHGWMGWKKNGELAGTEGEAKRLEGIQIFLCGKDEDVVYPKATTSQNKGVRKLDPSKPMVALTYDDGPYGPYTSRILDSLQANGGRATFFVVGNRVASNASVVKRASDMGCQIANHTYSHPMNFASLGSAGISSQINQCDAAVRSVTGKTPTMLRPVGGGLSSTLSATCNKPMINWSIDTLDWKYRDSNRVYNAVVNNVHDGDIVLMHDIHGTTAAASERIIPELTRRGYQLVTVEELAYYKGKNLTAHNVYNSCK